MTRHQRHHGFFGAAGQAALAQQRVAVVGCGGLGNHVIPQLACLGVQKVIAIDDEELSETNRNRYTLARHSDPVPGTHKVDIAARAVAQIDSAVEFEGVKVGLRSAAAFAALRDATTIFGCVDNDGARLVLNEFARAYTIPYFDLATDIPEQDVMDFGGRVSLVDTGPGCLVCRDLLDTAGAARDLESDAARADRNRIYGVPQEDLQTSGPSVVSLNGVVAALAVTEFIMRTTGLRSSVSTLNYRGRGGIVRAQKDGRLSCYYCDVVRGRSEQADLARYIVG